jgi:hypothetical protein
MTLTLEEAVQFLGDCGSGVFIGEAVSEETEKKIVEMQKLCGVHGDYLPDDVQTTPADVVEYIERERQ